LPLFCLQEKTPTSEVLTASDVASDVAQATVMSLRLDNITQALLQTSSLG